MQLGCLVCPEAGIGEFLVADRMKKHFLPSCKHWKQVEVSQFLSNFKIFDSIERLAEVERNNDDVLVHENKFEIVCSIAFLRAAVVDPAGLNANHRHMSVGWLAADTTVPLTPSFPSSVTLPA